MSEYKLEIKQLVDFPRCRIYRQFIRMLHRKRDIRIGCRAGLFHYALLGSYANFRTSYKCIEGISYIIRPGEWICTLAELTQWFRVRFQHQALSIMKELQDHHLITYSILGRKKLVKFRITNWHRHNRVQDYNAPCQKDTGFFFLPISVANELISYGRCSEMDSLLDLWINTVYNDDKVEGSSAGPVVYIRNGTGCPLISYAELGERWGISKTTAGRYLQKFQSMDFIELLSFPGTYGTTIYLKRFLSAMFEISDVLIDKDEVAMALNIKVDIPNEDLEIPELAPEVSVPESLSGVSNCHIHFLLQKIEKVLAAQGFLCCSCPNLQYKLLPLSSECRGTGYVLGNKVCYGQINFYLSICCGDSRELLRFEIHMTKEEWI